MQLSRYVYLFGDMLRCQGGMAPPVPIPNTVVKRASSENTWWVTAWEDSPMPELYLE